MFMTFVGVGETFRDSIVKPLKNVFSLGTEFEQTFRYLGLNMTQKQPQNHITSNSVHP